MTILRNAILIYIAGFAVFCGLRFTLGGTDAFVGAAAPIYQEINAVSQDFSYGKRNIATQKRASASAPQATDQKYEQVANIGTTTEEFDDDEARAREQIKSVNALVQFEQRSGLEGYRRLQLAVGVTPENFDALVDSLQGLGKLDRLQIDKTDKTNEYLDLQAKKVSLEKSRDSLIELKSREGDIDEMINLETRILDLEQQIQALGVNLGDFDAENEFSTVKLFLAEKTKSIVKGKGLGARLFEAAIWTLQYYTLLWVGLAAALVSVWVFLKLLAMILGAARLLDRNLKES